MQVKIYKDHAALSAAVVAEIILLLQTKSDPVLCMASGDTPRLSCQVLAEKVRKEQTDMRRLTIIGLDEWVGVPPDNDGSCHHFFQTELIQPMRIKSGQYHMFNALSANLEQECKSMDDIIRAKGGIDLMIVGIGMNGHIGFNEPGISTENYSHVAALDESTTTVGQKYFKQPVALSKGITLGLKHFQEAKKVLLLANGIKKAEVVQKAVEGKASAKFPASIIQAHANGIVMTDKEAASFFKKNY